MCVCVCVGGGVWLWSVCFPLSVFGPTTNVYTASPSPPYLLPFSPSLQRFTEQHQGLASWCLHCKSGLTIRPWLDPTHIQKHLIYLFILLFCMASRCVRSDQGDMITSNCYSLHLQVSLFSNRPRPARLNEILRPRCANGGSFHPQRGDAPPRMSRSGVGAVKTIRHGFREWTWLCCKTGPRRPFSWICAGYL